MRIARHETAFLNMSTAKIIPVKVRAFEASGRPHMGIVTRRPLETSQKALAGSYVPLMVMDEKERGD